MKKRSQTLQIVIILIVSAFSAFSVQSVFSFGRREKTSDQRKMFCIAEKKWEEKGIAAYMIDITYSSGNRPPEEISMEVLNGTVTNWVSSSGSSNYSADFINSLTIENMFERMKKSLEAEGTSALKLSAEYDEKLGYIKKLSRYIPRDADFNQRVPLGTDYHIKVMNFKVVE